MFVVNFRGCGNLSIYQFNASPVIRICLFVCFFVCLFVCFLTFIIEVLLLTKLSLTLQGKQGPQGLKGQKGEMGEKVRYIPVAIPSNI